MKDIQIKVYGGHSSEILTFPLNKAKEYILEQVEKQGKWVNVNGKHYEALDITEDLLKTAENITLTNLLIGA